MGAIVGVVVGYVLGTRAGEKGWEELRDAWETISTSEEVRDLVSGGLSMAGDMVRRASDLVNERLNPGGETPLRSAA
ncbi:MAG TPA: hypothetical protein VKB57_21460 [Acidimicrobiales bacterium]|nr:hypothetical protein [Acidimicrobiales bacterium]